jgi:23S rRNA-/tRNA-specific pseudouridylate synthase
VWHHQEKLVFPVPASRIQQLIEQGLVQVNGKVCTSKKTTVQPGDRISLTIPDAKLLGSMTSISP